MAVSLAAQENVVRLEITVRDARAMGGRKPVEELEGDDGRLFRREPATRQARFEWLAVEKLADHEARAVRQFAGVKNVENVRVVDARSRACFGREACVPRFGSRDLGE